MKRDTREAVGAIELGLAQRYKDGGQTPFSFRSVDEVFDDARTPCRCVLSIPCCQALRGVMLLGLLALAACVSVRVEPLTTEIYPPNSSAAQVKWLKFTPDAPHVKLARIIATSQSADEDALREKILARAATLGADAVVMGKSDVLESVGTGTVPQSTMGPAGGSGWWPFYYDRWSFAQGSVDETGLTEYLSGTAIRYLHDQH